MLCLNPGQLKAGDCGNSDTTHFSFEAQNTAPDKFIVCINGDIFLYGQ